jgi:hypothetical protein
MYLSLCSFTVHLVQRNLKQLCLFKYVEVIALNFLQSHHSMVWSLDHIKLSTYFTLRSSCIKSQYSQSLGFQFPFISTTTDFKLTHNQSSQFCSLKNSKPVTIPILIHTSFTFEQSFKARKRDPGLLLHMRHIADLVILRLQRTSLVSRHEWLSFQRKH